MHAGATRRGVVGPLPRSRARGGPGTCRRRRRSRRRRPRRRTSRSSRCRTPGRGACSRAVKERSIPVATLLAEARPSELEGDTLTIEFRPGAGFHRTQIEEPKQPAAPPRRALRGHGTPAGGRDGGRRRRPDDRRRPTRRRLDERGRDLAARERPRRNRSGGDLVKLDMNAMLKQAQQMQAADGGGAGAGEARDRRGLGRRRHGHRQGERRRRARRDRDRPAARSTPTTRRCSPTWCSPPRTRRSAPPPRPSSRSSAARCPTSARSACPGCSAPRRARADVGRSRRDPRPLGEDRPPRDVPRHGSGPTRCGPR